MKLVLLSAVLVLLVSLTTGARILALLPFAGKSHHIFFQAVLKALAARGHHVVVYSSFNQSQPVDNYQDVYVYSSFNENYVTYELLQEWLNASPGLATLRMFWEKTALLTEEAFQDKNIQKLAQSNEKFDLVITETFFGQSAFLGFGHKFQAPTIVLQSFGLYSVINRVMGNDLAISHIPNHDFDASNRMTFTERARNAFMILGNLFFFYTEHIPHHEKMMQRYLQLDKAPPLGDMMSNISLVLVNAHPTIHYAQPWTPNLVPVGGIHVASATKPLAQDIKKFMDEAKHGVIYLSLGSFVPDHQMPTEYFLTFIRAFEKLPQRVLWKTRAKNLPGLPANVKTTAWVSQQDVLGHSNCVLFITHGGLLSLLEVVHAGVPVIGIPFYGDQPTNVRFYLQTGMGLKLDFLKLSEQTISHAISIVLRNPSFKENAVRLSQVFRDLPRTAQETAVYWTEYVLRHAGAPHLQPASARLSFTQYALLDVVAALTAVLVAAGCLLALAVRGLLRWTSKKPTLKKKTN